MILPPSEMLAFAQVDSKVIRHSGFADFIRGPLGNSGANLYASVEGHVQLINKWDFNKDGYIDLLISNDHDKSETVDVLYPGEMGRVSHQYSRNHGSSARCHN
jgi:hypothetical protein